MESGVCITVRVIVMRHPVSWVGAALSRELPACVSSFRL